MSIAAVLVVDDREVNRYLLRSLLEPHGYSVREAAEGETALAMARAEPPDVIVSDILMPGMDGFALCREWKRDPDLSRIPFVFYTATYTDEHEQSLALGLGADLFVAKPIEPEEFLRRLEDLLEAVRSGRAAPAAPSLVSEGAPELAQDHAFLTRYSQALVHRLELKMEELETANRELRENVQHGQRLNLVLRTIRHVNQLITREDDPERLLQEACRCLTEGLGYACAWIARLNPADGQVVSVAASELPTLERLRTELQAERLPGCMQDALASDGVVVIMPPKERCSRCPVAPEGSGSLADLTCALRFGDAIYGVLTAAVPVSAAEDPEEADLFRELAGDVGFALHRMALHEALQETQARYRQVFEGSRDGIVMVDPSGRILDANHAYCEMLGYTLEELRALPNFYSITPERWHDWEREEIWNKRLLGSGYSGIYEKEYRRKDGTVFPVEIHAYAVRDASGELQYLWGVVRDITERKKAEEEIRKSEDRYRSLFEQSSEGIFLHDLDGRILDVNARACEQTGYTREELLQKTVFDLIAPESPVNMPVEEILAEWRRWKPGDRVNLEIEHVRKDGTVFPVALSSGPVWIGDRQLILALTQDITERKKAEREMAEQLDELRRWHRVMLDRSDRMIELKREVNELLARLGEPPRYQSPNADLRTGSSET